MICVFVSAILFLATNSQKSHFDAIRPTAPKDKTFSVPDTSISSFDNPLHRDRHFQTEVSCFSAVAHRSAHAMLTSMICQTALSLTPTDTACFVLPGAEAAQAGGVHANEARERAAGGAARAPAARGGGDHCAGGGEAGVPARAPREARGDARRPRTRHGQSGRESLFISNLSLAVFLHPRKLTTKQLELVMGKVVSALFQH